MSFLSLDRRTQAFYSYCRELCLNCRFSLVIWYLNLIESDPFCQAIMRKEATKKPCSWKAFQCRRKGFILEPRDIDFNFAQARLLCIDSCLAGEKSNVLLMMPFGCALPSHRALKPSVVVSS